MAEVTKATGAAAPHNQPGRHAEAVARYRRMLQADPYQAEVYVNLGIALRSQGRPGEAVACYKQAIQLKPEFVESRYNLANVLKDLGRHAEAIESYQKAIELKPDFAQAHYNLGNTLRGCGRLLEATESYRQAVRLRDGYAIAYVNLAMTLKDLGRTEEAVENYTQAIRFKPDCPEAHNNLGIALKELGRLDEAVESYAEAIRLSPDYAEAHSNLGIALHAQGRHDEALDAFERAIEIKPEYAQAHWNRSLVLLLKGRFEEGWREYRWRRKTNLAAFAYPHKLDKPLWDGRPFPGKRLLVHYEQGLGDNLQFVRYLPMVKRLGGTVIFETPKSMSGLLRSFDGIAELVETSPDGPPQVEFDFYTSLIDLPAIFGTTLETIPAEVPYIHADPAKVEHWRGRLAGEGLKVGLVWAGRPARPDEVLSLQHRSCSLEHFGPLADVSGVVLYGLQKGPAAAQVGKVSGRIVVENLGEKFEDFTDTAAAIDNLDLVISIDTSVAHLAGAMGKPVWLLLKTDADWRWLLDRTDNPWYPTMRLFRQRRPGDWAEVLERVTAELKHVVTTGCGLKRSPGPASSTRPEARQTGRIHEADSLYRDILCEQPEHPVSLHSLGALAYQRGRYDEAAELVGRAIKADPQAPQFHNTLGVILEAQDKPGLAVDSYRHAVSLKADYAEAYNNMAIALQAQGRYAEAIEQSHKAISIDPDYAAAYNTLGFALQVQGELDRAKDAYRRAAQLNANFAEAHNHLGVVLSKQGCYDEAAENYRQALRINPEYAEVHNNLSIALKGLGELDAAIESCREALKLDPDFAEAYFNLANAMRDLGRNDEALANYARALEINPDYAEAFNNRAILLNDLGRYDEAMADYERAISLKPDYAEAYNNLGIVLRNKGRLSDAESRYRRAMQLEPQFSEAHYNLGNVLKGQGRCADAIRSYDRAIELEPDYAQAHWNRSHAFLLGGDLDKGWRGYEWRRSTELGIVTYPHRHRQPRWDGSSFAGKRLLVHCEQGLGDSIQFMRYLPMVKARGGTVIFEAWKPLHCLLQNFAEIDELLELSFDKETDVEFDLHVSLMDLPAIFGTTLETIPAETPYIHPDPAKVTYWRDRLDDTNLKVGIVWAGSPSHGNDHNRSCTLELFAPLTGIDGVRLYGLQEGPAAAQARRLSPATELTSLSESLNDFADTAAVIANLDLVISVDTAPAHLAGAMGRPTWVLLPFAPDWRWMLDRADSPWYPTMRLFRQKQWGDWDPVFQRVHKELCQLATSRHTP